MTAPAHVRWLYTIPIEGGTAEFELWSGSTDRDEITGVVALTYGLRADQVKVRKAQ